MLQLFFILTYQLFERTTGKAAYLRDRPRGLGLLQLPTGISDERSGPIFPGIYIAGNKVNEKPQTVPDVHLPGQALAFSGRSAFNPFTHIVSAAFAEDITDSYGIGYAVNVHLEQLFKGYPTIYVSWQTAKIACCAFLGVNSHNLNVRKNFDAYADVPLNLNDGMHQPFIIAFTQGIEFDYSKIAEIAGNLNLPIPGINELFDLDGRLMAKAQGRAIINGALEFPLTLSDPNERVPYTLKYVMWAPDRHMAYGHVMPNVNLFVIGKDKIMERLQQNRLNPTMIG